MSLGTRRVRSTLLMFGCAAAVLAGTGAGLAEASGQFVGADGSVVITVGQGLVRTAASDPGVPIRVSDTGAGAGTSYELYGLPTGWDFLVDGVAQTPVADPLGSGLTYFSYSIPASAVATGRMNMVVVPPVGWTGVLEDIFVRVATLADGSEPVVQNVFTEFDNGTFGEWTGSYGCMSPAVTTAYVCLSPGGQGNYALLNNPHPFNLPGVFADIGDHTTGTGRMFVLDAAYGYPTFFEVTQAIEPKSWYQFSTWATSANVAAWMAPGRFHFEGALIAGDGTVLSRITLGDSGDMLNTDVRWRKIVSDRFYSGDATSMVLAVMNAGTFAGSGNDQALDDVSLAEFAPGDDKYTTEFAVTVDATTSLVSGNVFRDLDYSFTKDAGDVGIANPVVQITGGYGFGPNGADDAGTGDDVPVSAPITASVGAAIGVNLSSPVAGDYVFADLPEGRYDITVSPSAGSHVVILPSAAVDFPLAGLSVGSTAHGVVAVGGQRVTGVDFGVQGDVTAPVAVADAVTIGATTATVVVPVLTTSVGVNTTAHVALDTAADTVATQGGAAPAVAVTTAPAKGTAGVDAHGRVEYTPDSAFVSACTTAGGAACQDTLIYQVTDKAGQTASATLTITMQAIPTGVGGSATIPVGETTSFEASPATRGSITGAAISSAPDDGVAAVGVGGLVEFDGTGAAVGTYPFAVTLTDNLGQVSQPVLFSVRVQVPPTAVGGKVTIPLNGSHVFDADPHSAGNIVSALVVANPTTLAVAPAGAATADVVGAVTFNGAGLPVGVYTFGVMYVDDFGLVVTVGFEVTIQAPKPTPTPTSTHTSTPTPTPTSTRPSKPTPTRAPETAPAPTGTPNPTPTPPPTSTPTASPAPTPGPTSADGGWALIRVGESHSFQADLVTPGSIVSAKLVTPPSAGRVAVWLDGKVVFTAGDTPPGTYEFTVAFTDDRGQTVLADFVVVVVSNALPITGATTGALSCLALFLLAAGTLLRRRCAQ